MLPLAMPAGGRPLLSVDSLCDDVVLNSAPFGSRCGSRFPISDQLY